MNLNMTTSGRTRRSQSGFTMIELLIATSVFAVILMTITVAVISFSRQYYKGLISSATQNTSRTIIDDITRAVQFNSGDIYTISSGGASGICVGSSKIYAYALNRQVTDGVVNTSAHQSPHGLVSYNLSSCNSGTVPITVTSDSLSGLQNARELLGQHMRLSRLNVGGDNGLYTITVRVVYGDDDLLCSPSKGDCNDPAARTGVNSGATDLICRSNIGSQFCAVSELTTTVDKRVGK